MLLINNMCYSLRFANTLELKVNLSEKRKAKQHEKLRFFRSLYTRPLINLFERLGAPAATPARSCTLLHRVLILRPRWGYRTRYFADHSLNKAVRRPRADAAHNFGYNNEVYDLTTGTPALAECLLALAIYMLELHICRHAWIKNV